MRRLLLPGFWLSVLWGAGAAVYAGTTGHFVGFVLAGALACVAVLALAELCWRDQGATTALLGLVVGTRDCVPAQEADLLWDVSELEVAGVFVLARDFLAYLKGGTGSYSLHGRRNQWPDDADLFLSWRAPRKAVIDETRRLNGWEAAHEPLRLTSSSACPTVLVDRAGHRLVLPNLRPAETSRAAHPGGNA
jgi:hypothetical protein